MAYVPSFDLIFIDADGFRQALPGTTVNIYNVTDSASAGTVVSNSAGMVTEGSIAVDPGDVLEYTVTGFTATFRLVAQSTQLLAYTAVENDGNAFIVYNLYNQTNESEVADLFVQDRNSTAAPINVGAVRAGETVRIPYVVTAQKLARTLMVSRDIEGQQSDSGFDTAERFDLTIPGPGSAKFDVLFDQYEDATTTGTTRQTLYAYPMPANKLDNAGDKMTADYAGVFAANGNNKRVILSFAGTDLFDTATIVENNSHWSGKVSVIRVSNTTVRAFVNFASNVHWAPVYTQIAGLDLDATSYNLNLDALTSAVPGDVTAKMAYGVLIPRVPQTQFGTTLQGFSLSFMTGSLAATPFETHMGGLYLTFEPGEARHYVYSDPPGPGEDWGDLELEPPVS